MNVVMQHIPVETLLDSGGDMGGLECWKNDECCDEEPVTVACFMSLEGALECSSDSKFWFSADSLVALVPFSSAILGWMVTGEPTTCVCFNCCSTLESVAKEEGLCVIPSVLQQCTGHI